MIAVQTEVQTITLGDWVHGSGVAGWVVLFLTILAVGIALRCLFQLRMEQLAPTPLQRALETAIHSGDLTRAAADAAASSSVLGRLTTAGLRMKGLGLDEMLANVERAATRESIALGNRVSHLSRIGGAVLLMGFFATALGFISVLSVTSATPGAPAYPELARGFAISLYGASLALLSATGCFCAFFILDSRVTKATIRVSEIADEIQYLVAQKKSP